MAVALYQEALPYLKDNRQWRNYYIGVINLATAYNNLERYRESLYLLVEIDIEALKTIDDSWILSGYYCAKAKAMSQLEHNEMDVLKAFDTSLNYAFRVKDVEFLAYYNDYLDYLISCGELERADFNQFKIDSVFKTSNLIYKVDFLTLLLESGLDEEFKTNHVDFKNLVALKDSLYKITSESIKNELLLNRNKLLNIDEYNKSFKKRERLYFFLALLTLIGFLLLTLKTLFDFKNVKLKAKNSIQSVKDEFEKDNLALRQELISLNFDIMRLQNDLSNNDDAEKGHNPMAGFWNQFRKKFQAINPQFMERFRKDFPQLSDADLDLVSFIRLNLSNKEMAALFQITYRSLIVKKQRLKKKIGLEPEQDLRHYINNF